MKRHLLLLFCVLLATCVQSQHVYSTNPDSATLFPTVHGSFEQYCFMIDGKAIEQHELVNFPGAKLNIVFPYPAEREGQNYRGILNFHTLERYAPPFLNKNDPAFFINGRQVNPRHFRHTNIADYTRIAKSERDTIINGTRYHGCIWVETDEDFFADRLALPDLIEKHTGLPPERVIVHWRGANRGYSSAAEVGTILTDHFPIYYFSITNPDIMPAVPHPIRFNLLAVEVDSIRFAEGIRYVVHLVDLSYTRSTAKAHLFLPNPLAVDTVSPCYVDDFDPGDDFVFTSTEIFPTPYKGEVVYLKKLSAAMGLPADAPVGLAIPDSITVQFIVLRDGMLTAVESTGPKKNGQEKILQAIKRLACVWSPGVMGGRPVLTQRKMTIHYSKDRNGGFLSLNSLVFLPIRTTKP